MKPNKKDTPEKRSDEEVLKEFKSRFAERFDVDGNERLYPYPMPEVEVWLRTLLVERPAPQKDTHSVEEGFKKGYTKALREIDIGSHDYVTARRAISELSGKPMMALTFDEHLDVIREKLQVLTQLSQEAEERGASRERERIKKALRAEYEETFHWGKDEKFGTYITETEFEAIIKKTLTP